MSDPAANLKQPLLKILSILAGCAVVVWALSRVEVRRPETESAASETTEDSTDAWDFVSFDELRATQPDESYQPVYARRLRDLDGQEVRMRGFMSPYDDLENLQRFLLLSYPTGCNFCAPPSVNQVVLVRQEEGKRKYPFVDSPIEIKGTLRLWTPESRDPAHADDFLLYVMDETTVTPIDNWEPAHTGHEF